MVKRFFCVLVCLFVLLGSTPSYCAEGEGALSVPVAYSLVPDGKTIEGFIVGGSIFEPQGLVIAEAPGTATLVIEYPAIDRLESLALDSQGILTMKVTLADGRTIMGWTKPPSGAPLLLLTDVEGQGTEKQAGVRRFTPENFRGIDLIEVQAAEDLDFEALEPLAKKFLQAIQAKDIETTNEVFELLAPHFIDEEDEEGEEDAGE